MEWAEQRRTNGISELVSGAGYVVNTVFHVDEGTSPDCRSWDERSAQYATILSISGRCNVQDSEKGPGYAEEEFGGSEQVAATAHRKWLCAMCFVKAAASISWPQFFQLHTVLAARYKRVSVWYWWKCCSIPA